MCSLQTSNSPHQPLSPRSRDSPSYSNDVLNPQTIAELLDTKGRESPTYSIISRESTPCVYPSTKNWIQRIDMLDHSLEVLQAGNNREACRANIVDDKYWEIEANHYKTWLDSNLLWENLKSLEREHDTQFYTEIGGLGWARTHAEVLSKAVGMEKHHRVVFDVLYHKHRANYWKRVCRDNGSLCTRMDIQESYYWETEFSYMLNELQKVEKEVSRRTVAAHLRKENKSMHSNTARGRDQSKIGKIYNLRRRIVRCS